MDYPRKVYAIQHNITRKIYVGSSANLNKRYKQHFCLLKNGIHPVEDMQDDFNKYGDQFSLYIVDDIAERKENEKEFKWMRTFESHIRGIGYNYNDLNVTNNDDRFEIGECASVLKASLLYRIKRNLSNCTDLGLLDLIVHLLEKSASNQDKQPSHKHYMR